MRASRSFGRALFVLALTAIALSACGVQAPASISHAAPQPPRLPMAPDPAEQVRTRAAPTGDHQLTTTGEPVRL
jgi:hypothetical protein